MELIIEPQVLFLDEPTTGLDANTAVSVAEKLKVLSEERECVIIMSIHQPRYSIFKLFDTLTLLSQGSMVYHGQANMALEYFDRSLGFACEEHENPADFFLDVMIRCEKASKIDSEFDKEEGGAVDMEASYQRSSQYQATEHKLSAIMDNLKARETMKVAVSKPLSYATSFFWQVLIVCLRSFKNLVRSPTTFVMPIVIMAVLALLVGVLYFRLDTKSFNSCTVINDRLGALFFIVMNQVFINIPAVSIFIQLRALFLHENVSGFYRVSSFFIAKVFAYMLPMRMIPLVFYVVITYFMVGFQREASNFFIYFLTLGLTSITATSWAFAISARVSITPVALALVALCYILSVLFGGFLISLNTLPVWLRWLKYLSFFRYSIEALTINEIAGQCFFDTTNATGNTCNDYLDATGLQSCELPACVNGTEDLVQRGYETDTDWLWYDQIGLVGLTIIFLVLAYINLRTIKKLK